MKRLKIFGIAAALLLGGFVAYLYADGQFSEEAFEFYEGKVAFEDGRKEAAAKHFERAAELGHTKAQSVLGSMYFYGEGVPQNYQEAVRLFQMAGDDLSAANKSALGTMYAKGQGVPQDFEMAFQWWSRAADEGDVEGQYFLGVSFYEGLAVTSDHRKAVAWFRKAANKDYSSAFNYLAWVLATSAVVRDPDNAISMARRSVAGNDGYAARNVLAAALAAGGQFEQAAVEQERAIAMAPKNNNTMGQANGRLQLYRSQKILTCPGGPCK